MIRDVRLILLGTGTSSGVPVIGCDCAVCTSDDPRDRRQRCAILIDEGPTRLLVDTPPDLRVQCLTAGVERIDALLYTHAHAVAPLRVQCFLSALTVKRGLRLSASVVNAAGEEVYAKRDVAFSKQTTVHPVPIAAWPDGWYRARVTVSDRAGRALSESKLVLRKVAGPFD